MFSKTRFFLVMTLLFVCFGLARAQSTEFTYQGRLLFGDVPANGSYDFEFALFDAATGGSQLGSTFPLSAVNVNNGVFSVRVDFGNQFPGSSRFLEIHVRQAGAGIFAILAPRQAISSAPYAIKSLNAATSDNAISANQLGGVSADQFVVTNDPRLSDARDPLPNSASYVQNTMSQQVSSNFNISGTGTANILSAATQFNLNGNRILSISGNENLFVGARAGEVNTGGNNAFVGYAAGLRNTTGSANSFFGDASGSQNTGGTRNTFFGANSGASNLTGNENSFFGSSAGSSSTAIGNSFFGSFAGISTTTGGNNTFVGRQTGSNNTTGNNNTVVGALADIIGTGQTFSTAIGAQADINGDNVTFATAIGAGASVSTSNTIVLGRSLDSVVVPGSFSVNGTSAANTLSATTQFNLNGDRILSASGFQNLFIGGRAGEVDTGADNAFVGYAAGLRNTTGGSNAFFGNSSGLDNTTGNANSYFGFAAGSNGTTGSSNSFFGSGAGQSSNGNGNSFFGSDSGAFTTTGGDNAFFGRGAGDNNTTGSNITLIGSRANISGVGQTFSTAVGSQAVISGDNLTFATAIGANASVSTSNTVVIGRSLDSVMLPGPRVGLGTNAPAKHLHVFGAGDQEIAIESSDAGGRRWTLQSSRGTSNGNFQIIDRSANASRLAIDLNGNVGVGTTAPTEKLQVNGNTLITGNLTVNGTTNFPTTGQYIWNSTAQQPGGNFNIAGSGTAAGTLSGNIVTATTQFNIGATRAVRSDVNGIAIGRNAWASDGGDANAFVGQDAGFANTGSNNAFLGDSAGQSNTSGSSNAFVGNGAGFANTTGSGNSFFGNFAGGNTTGSNNTLLGTTAATASGGLTFATALGANAVVSTNDTIVLGKVAGTYGGLSRPADTVLVRGLLQLPTLGAAGSVALCRNASNQLATCSSSMRYKKDINSFTAGLGLIRRLRPVSFNWKADGIADFGLVAEEVNKVEPLLTTRNEKGQVEGVKYDRVGVVLINAVNEQQSEIEAQQKQIDKQREVIQQQQTEIELLKKLVCSRNRSAVLCRARR